MLMRQIRVTLIESCNFVKFIINYGMSMFMNLCHRSYIINKIFLQTPADLLNGAGPELDPELLRRSMVSYYHLII